MPTEPAQVIMNEDVQVTQTEIRLYEYKLKNFEREYKEYIKVNQAFGLIGKNIHWSGLSKSVPKMSKRWMYFLKSFEGIVGSMDQNTSNS